MDVRLRIAVASEGVEVAALCRELGISRQSFYKWRARYRAEGLEGLEPRSRAPRSNPRRSSAEIEDAVVALRKELDELGVDAGAATIRWHLDERGLVEVVPSEATIWRILKRRGFIIAEPNKRPRSSYQRFEASAPNELWQADVIDWALTSGGVKVISFIDDHSRLALGVRAVSEATSEATWETFSTAAEAWGLPVGQLSDNGLNFSGRLRGFEVFFERQLRAAGVVPKTSRPYHPQTCGKVERFQQTLKRWLRARDQPGTLAELQDQLDAFVAYYNHHRPHRGIGRTTPAARWTATPPAINLGIALPSPTHRSTGTVTPNGVITLSRYHISVGVRWAGHRATVHHDNTHAAVFIDHQLVRALRLDPTRRYQPRHPRNTPT